MERIMKEKIAIITMYHNSTNYGGLAQAYALQKFLSNNGYQVELISYEMERRRTSIKKKLREHFDLSNGITGITQGFKWAISYIFNKFVDLFFNVPQLKKRSHLFIEKNKKLKAFRDSIPHSKIVNSNTIHELKDDYDIFISGSDQIWKPGLVQDAFVLDFVKDKKKIAYSSSVTTINIENNKEYCEYMKEKLNSFSAVSVREEQTKVELERVIGKHVELVLDPTLLLEREEWELLCSNRLVAEPYIFTYFLGSSLEQREFVNKFAEERNLKVVTIPYCSGVYNRYDEKCANQIMYNAGIEDFFSLIKNAEYVFTDSFHAICFSWIFNTRFFVFNRYDGKNSSSMSSRILSILKIMNLSDLLITTSSTDLDKKIEFSSSLFDKIKNSSISYLMNSLKCK